MWKDRPEIIKLAKEFAKICKEHNIWYSVENGTLLGTIRNKGMIPWDDDFDVTMTPESFEQLKKLFPNNIADTDINGYPLLIPKFMNNKNNYLSSAVFVDIFLLIESNDANIKKFNSFRNKSRFALQCVHSDWHAFNLGSKILKIISYPFKWIPKKMTYQEGITILKSTDPIVHYTIDNPIDPRNINEQKLLSLKTITKQFEDFNVQVVKEYDQRLKIKYTKNYMTPDHQARSIEHINAISIKKVKRKIEDY